MAATLSTDLSDMTLHQNEPTGEPIYQTLKKWKKYPFNIGPYVQPNNRPGLTQQIRRHFERIKANALYTLDDSEGTARKNAIERKIRTVWFDSSHTPESAAGDLILDRTSSRHDEKTADHADDEAKRIKGSAHLEAYLGIFGIDSRPRLDPVFRFITLETSAPGSPRLNITDELLLKILTYHHVSPYFLENISHICREPPMGMTEVPFSGFRSLKSFGHMPSTIPASEALDRSGLHYQLIFNFRIVINPDDSAATVFSWDDDLILWPIVQCAIYHRFDISTGKSLWILTPPATTANRSGDPSDDINNIIPPWHLDKSKTTRKLLEHLGVPSPMDPSSTPTERFLASLAVMTWLADWSLSEYNAYISTLHERMWVIALQSTHSRTPLPVYQITLKTLNQYLEEIDQIIAALESNLSVLKNLLTFYTDDFLNDADLASLDTAPQWLTSSDSASSHSSSPGTYSPPFYKSTTTTTTTKKTPASSSPPTIESLTSNFRTELSSICSTYTELIRRANRVREIGTRREDTTYRLVQQADTTVMKTLAKVTIIFSTITLFLLPMSVVSTIFSTDIVKFAFPSSFSSSSSSPSAETTQPATATSSAPGTSQQTTGVNGDGGGGGMDFRGTWSAPAVVWWLISTVIATALVGGIGERWRRKSVAAMELGENYVPSSRYIAGVSDEDLMDDGEDGGGRLGIMMRRVKRVYEDLEWQGRAKVQWITGNMALIRQRWLNRGSSRKSGSEMEMEMDGRAGSLDADLER